MGTKVIYTYFKMAYERFYVQIFHYPKLIPKVPGFYSHKSYMGQKGNNHATTHPVQILTGGFYSYHSIQCH
ncbi:hypothetical protein Hdeb2414_s0021g00574321 [Helianthus debilis subsp. tardiflorus]